MAAPISNAIQGNSPFNSPFSGGSMANAQRLGLNNSNISITPLGTQRGQLASSDPVFNSAPYSAPRQQNAASTSGLLTPSAASSQRSSGGSTSGGSGILGYYKSTPIYSGQDVSAQMAKIDGTGNSTNSTASPTTIQSAPSQSSGTGTQNNQSTGYTGGLFPSVEASLANPQQPQMTTDAANAYTQQNQALQDYERQAGQLLQGIYSPNVTTSGAAMTGRANAAAQAINETIGNLQGAVTKQQGLIGLGQAQQGLNQGAQEYAANLAQPHYGNIGDVVVSPLDTTQQNLLGNNVPGGLTGAANLKGGYNAALQNAQTVGTIGTNTAAQGSQQATTAYKAMDAANNQFENQASQLLNVLQTYKNNGSIPALNRPLNQLSGALGSQGISALSSAFAETVAAYTNLLTSNGGTPSAQDTQAMQALNINSTPQQIATAIQQLQAAAQIKLTAARGLAGSYNSSLYGGNSSGSGSGGGWASLGD